MSIRTLCLEFGEVRGELKTEESAGVRAKNVFRPVQTTQERLGVRQRSNNPFTSPRWWDEVNVENISSCP